MSRLASVLEYLLKGGRRVQVGSRRMYWLGAGKGVGTIWIDDKGPLDRTLLFIPVMDS